MERSSRLPQQDVWEQPNACKKNTDRELEWNLPLSQKKKKKPRQTSASSLYNDLMYANDLASVNEGTINHCNDGLI